MNACAVALTFRCPMCQDRHRIYSFGLKQHIGCPSCTRRPRNDPSGLRALAKSETERRQAAIDREAMRRGRELAKALQFAERVASRARELDPKRAPVDRIMQRWSVGVGSGLPRTSDEMDLVAQLAAEQPDTFSAPPARSPPLDDESQIIVDRIVLKAPSLTRAVAQEWYLSPTPARVMAEDLAVSVSTLYRYWYDTLDYLRERFSESGSRTLARLMTALV